MNHFLSLVAGGLLLAGTAQAQATFRVGPRVGFNATTVHFSDADENGISSSFRPGFEAGLLGNLQVGHFAFQPSVLFSQKGYRSAGPAFGLAVYGPARYEETVRLNCLTVPLNLAFTLRRDGQGLQAFAGPYVGMLLGGKYARRTYYTGSPFYPTPIGGLPEAEYTLPVKAGSPFSDNDNWYSQRFDAGLQAGLGYRFGGLLVQANYSLGLRNLASAYQSSYDGKVYEDEAYYNRSWQVSLSYLVGPKS
ncbi:MAG: porin family protein [Janthinobacterium lividum]